jgi:hypothetical protein
LQTGERSNVYWLAAECYCLIVEKQHFLDRGEKVVLKPGNDSPSGEISRLHRFPSASGDRLCLKPRLIGTDDLKAPFKHANLSFCLADRRVGLVQFRAGVIVADNADCNLVLEAGDGLLQFGEARLCRYKPLANFTRAVRRVKRFQF